MKATLEVEEATPVFRCGNCGKKFEASPQNSVWVHHFRVVCNDCHAMWSDAIAKQLPDDIHPRDLPVNEEARVWVAERMCDFTFIPGVTESPQQYEIRLLWDYLSQVQLSLNLMVGAP